MTAARRDFPLWTPLAGALSGLGLMIPVWLVFGFWAGWVMAEDSGQIGWAILTVPAGPVIILPLLASFAPVIAFAALLWALLALILNLFLRPTDKMLIGSLQGLACGVAPALVVAARASNSDGGGLQEGLGSALPSFLPQPSVLLLLLCLIAGGFAGMTVAGIVAVRRRPV
ncbi:hypothetical protein [Brevundimonas sp. GCM10030266]|uniref:hypothetical protein n=1 Tax=Brevundimonas sp. GCM10030266 TaxID=3273386 RepID=UPI00360C3C20